ncbi:MAG: hypothetical protein IPH28_15065 [Cytophagaceae bacterium]|nr:hypothetical protein [Cytophagaceae bacterium]
MCDWEIVNAPINSTLTYVEPTGELVFSANANTTGSTKSEEITIKELGGTYTESIVVTQPAVSGTSTPLTSITPNANSSGYQLNNSTDGNTMVSGCNNGIGTQPYRCF